MQKIIYACLAYPFGNANVVEASYVIKNAISDSGLVILVILTCMNPETM